MLLGRKNNPFTLSRHARLSKLESADTGVDAQDAVLVLQVGSQTDPGLRRKDRPNEDSIFVTQGMTDDVSPKPFALLMVADGMGGHEHGQEASQLAIKSLVTYVSGSLHSQQKRTGDFLSLLREGVEHANCAVYERNQELRTKMGTTMTVCLVVDTTAYVAHVGDSRCYLYHKPTGLTQITQDHSVVAALVAAGVIQPEDIYTHPSRNLIYRCLGEKSHLEVDTFTVQLASGDTLLLCSDGLWEMVRDQQIAAILTTPIPTPSDTAHTLIQAALAGGGEDNVSAIVARVSNA